MSVTAISEMDESGIRAAMAEIGARAKAASAVLAHAPTAQKNAALSAAADAILARTDAILAANEADMDAAQKRKLSPAMLDRLKLTRERIEAIAEGVRAIVALPDPIGAVMTEWTRPNGLHFERVRVPLGVIGIIYESRPNVTADAGALCLKSGNAVILRGGSESFLSSRAIHDALVEGLTKAELPEAAIQLVPTRDRAAVGEMLKGLDGAIDVIVPRGGKNLIARVQSDARVPVFAHLEGLCHVYIDHNADRDKAVAIALNSKMRRTGICGAAETLLIDKAADPETKKAVVGALLKAGCEVRGDEAVRALDPRVTPAHDEDWLTEYLEPIISAREVDGVEGAVAHINGYGSHHTESIVTESESTANRFLALVDSAIVLHNASTQFADGGEFGFGAEIGISTGKTHARGPVGLEQLTSFKYVVRGQGQTRP